MEEIEIADLLEGCRADLQEAEKVVAEIRQRRYRAIVTARLHGWTAEKVGHALGISQQMVSKEEKRVQSLSRGW